MGGRIILSIWVGLALAGGVHADMMPISRLDSVSRQLPAVRPGCDLHQADLSRRFSSLGNVPGLDTLPLGSVVGANANSGHAAEAQPVHILTSGGGSLDLCLYALLGLGLFTYVPCAKNVALSSVAKWYHKAGLQIGYDHAIEPESLYCAAVCFFQPVCTGDTPIRQSRWGTVASLLRNSEFTRNVLSSRGPPHGRLA
jgi:hypothetical protein